MAPTTDIATRACVVTLKLPCVGKSTSEVAEIMGLSTRQVNGIYSRAIERGFDPNARPLIFRDEYFEDAPRSGRPPKQTDKAQEAVVGKV
jgi:hypothetical protein